MFLVSAQKRSRRLQICQDCEHYIALTKTCGTIGVGHEVTHEGEQRKLCGCIMPIKTRLKISSCPLDKWVAELSKEVVARVRKLVDSLEDNYISKEQNRELLEVWKLATGQNRNPTNCNTCIKGMINDMKKLLEDDTETS